MVKIKAFRKGDEEVYVKVHNDGYSTEEWFGTLEKMLQVEDFSKLDYDATFLAEVHDEAVGLVDIKIRNELAYIENIVVLPKYRRKGIGKALLKKAMDFSTYGNVKQTRAEIPAQNEGAIKFYGESGFRYSRNAYLIKVQDKSVLEPYLGREIYHVENTRYWVPDEEQMKLIRRLGVSFTTVGEFKVMIKNIGNV